MINELQVLIYCGTIVAYKCYSHEDYDVAKAMNMRTDAATYKQGR